MKTIWKYKLRGVSKERLELLGNAEILRVGDDFDTLCLWVLGDVGEPKAIWEISIIETGDLIREDIGQYVGTYFRRNKIFVYHFFAKKVGE